MKVAVTIGIALAIGGSHQALAFRGAHVPPNLLLLELPLIPCDDIPPPLATACLPNLHQWEEDWYRTATPHSAPIRHSHRKSRRMK